MSAIPTELLTAQDQIKPNQYWVNDKHQTVYFTIGVGRNSETLDVEVLYMSLNGEFWTRPWELFLEKFTKVEERHDN